MKHNVTLSSQQGQVLVKRSDPNAWTIIDEKLFNNGDHAGIAAHADTSVPHVKAALKNKTDGMVWLNKVDVPSEDERFEELDELHHFVHHPEYLKQDEMYGAHAAAYNGDSVKVEAPKKEEAPKDKAKNKE